MSVKKHTNAHVNFNHNLNISFVDPGDIKEYQALGYQFMMHKKPDIDLLLTLTPQEMAVLKLTLLSKEAKEIGKLLSLHEDTIRQFLRSIREKLQCKNNLALIIKMKNEGLDFYLLGNRGF